MLYRIFIIDSLSRARKLARTITTGSKPASFYATRVKVICCTSHFSAEDFITILSACKGVSTLAFWTQIFSSDYSERIVRIMQSLRLRRLSCKPSLIQASFEHSTLRALPHLLCLTHLEVVIADAGQALFFFDALSSLRITHLSVYNITFFDTTLLEARQCLHGLIPCLPDTISVCIVFFVRRTMSWALDPGDLRVLLAVDLYGDWTEHDLSFMRDNQMLLRGGISTFRKDWGHIPEGEIDMWEQAEIILAARNARSNVA